MTRGDFCAEFRRLVDALGMSDDDCVKELQISRPTIARYKRGEVAPHWFLRPVIIGGLKKRLTDEGRKLLRKAGR